MGFILPILTLAGQLSRGQRAKVNLARSLIGSTANILLDEPTNGLDPFSTTQFREVLQSYRRGQAAILVTSHSLKDIEILADRIVVIQEGRTIYTGTQTQIKQQTGCNSLEEAYLSLTCAG